MQITTTVTEVPATEPVDYLLALYEFCEGEIGITLNDHRTSYWTPAEEIQFREQNGANYSWVTKEMRDAMQAAGTMVDIRFFPKGRQEFFRFMGPELYGVLKQAFEKMVEVLDSETFVWEDAKRNCTVMLAELGNTAKATVQLTLNEHKCRYWDVKKQTHVYDATAKDLMRDIETCDEDMFKTTEHMGETYAPEISPDLRAHMEQLDEVLYIHYYPRTPVSFCSAYGWELEDLIADALESCKKAVAPE
jgi:hypothetical protein